MARIPSAARPWFISISSEVRDFDFTRNSAPWARLTSSRYRTASRPVAAKSTRPPFARTASAKASAIGGSWAARAEHAARSLHRLGDIPDQPVRGKEDDVHDRQGGGEPRRIVAGHLGNRSVLRNRELRPRHPGVRGGARGEGVLSADVFDKRDGQVLQGNRDEVAELPRKVCHDDSIRAVALQDGLEEPGGHRTGGRLVGLRFQRAKGDLEEVRKFRLRKNGSRPRWTR